MPGMLFSAHFSLEVLKDRALAVQLTSASFCTGVHESLFSQPLLSQYSEHKILHSDIYSNLQEEVLQFQQTQRIQHRYALIFPTRYTAHGIARRPLTPG